jgi:FkbH-like protein
MEWCWPMADLTWLPDTPGWDRLLDSLSDEATDAQWRQLLRLANCRIDFVQTGKLDRVAQRLAKLGIPKEATLRPLKIALLGSSTLRHLIPGIRVAGLRRGFWVTVFEGEYGQYIQELTDPSSALHAFCPDVICFAFDAEHLYSVGNGEARATLDHLRFVWSVAKRAFGCNIIQQTGLPAFSDLLGNNEHRLPDSPQTCISKFNTELRGAADAEGIDLLAVDKYAAIDGIRVWHDAALWHKSKQEIHPAVSQKYGDYVMRIVAAEYGRSSKCLVLDLDNTLWGGVIGDEGLSGITLGSGSVVGEAYLAFQRYLLQLRGRGVLLAVCSKNDPDNAFLPFDKHPEMLLKRSDIACFVANWQDKATNLKTIARTLNIGTDSLVFADDNPFERGLVRDQLPEVAVPELPEDPARYIEVLADACYFEATRLTHEDRQRAAQYQANAERESLKNSVADIADYLQGLQMELSSQPFDETNLQRILQLINKTNQFNLTTRRYSEAEVRAIMNDRNALTWQLRLRDRFGDNGMIAVIIGRKNSAKEFELETWLMSCRVLGRQIEDACMNLVVTTAQQLGALRMIGIYRPTAKNAMVRDFYSNFGFQAAGTNIEGDPKWILELDDYRVRKPFISVSEVALHAR